MIDAVTFANSYNAFWNDCAPTCEHFVRHINLGEVRRFEPPLPKSEASKRALIAEFAFSLFVERKKQAVNAANEISPAEIEEAAWLATEQRLAPYVTQGLALSRDLDANEHKEVDAIAASLSKFFGSERILVLRPLFKGCGYVDRSEGDVIFGNILYEIKTVERAFRGTDIRQLITYAALNFASKEFIIDRIGLFNPRKGLYFDVELESACREISGKSSQELLAVVIQTISSGEISR